MRAPRPRPPSIILASLLATLFAAAAQTATAATPRIVGGSVATRSWPAQGLLRVDGSICGGTLVSARWFLTAGHCAGGPSGPPLPATAFQITLGRPDRTFDPPSERHLVDRVLRHESYSETDAAPDHDLALLHISTPVAPAQEPLRLVGAAETQLWAAGTTAVVLGWGRTCADTCPVSSQLLQAGVPIVADDACGAAYGGAFRPGSMVCAGTGTTDTCQGDSGGPLMVARGDEFVLAGITSWGEDCANSLYPGVYTRLGAPALNAWVRARIPTASITAAPAAPSSSDPVTLTAGASTPASQPGVPSFSWDLDNDGAYDDAFGPTVSLPPRPPGGYLVRVQEVYPDGDRALGREIVGIAPAPPPPPPPPPPPAAVAKPLARLLNVPRRMRVKGLLDGRLPVRVSCTTACTIKGTLRLSGPTARKIGLTKRSASVQIATASARFARARSALVTPPAGQARGERPAQGERRHADPAHDRDARKPPSAAQRAHPPAPLTLRGRRHGRAPRSGEEVDRAPSIETLSSGAVACNGSGSGAPAAHIGDRLRLLPSGPDLIHGPTPRGTRAISTTTGGLTPKAAPLERGFGLAIADYERQGTADSPPSTVRHPV